MVVVCFYIHLHIHTMPDFIMTDFEMSVESHKLTCCSVFVPEISFDSKKKKFKRGCVRIKR